MKFLILICTLPERADKLKRLTTTLDKQIANFNGEVSYKCHDAGRSLTTGRKRNMLIEQSESDYFSFVDDDDNVSDHYVNSIMNAIYTGPDVVTFCGHMTTNGTNRREFTIKLGSKYEERDGHYYRFPNHLCAFKREKVNMVKFPEQWVQEDFIWAKQINDQRLLKTEVHIESDLYWYDFNYTPKFHERRHKVR